MVLQVLRRYFCEKLQDTATTSFISCFTSVFISADVIYCNSLELYSTLSDKGFRCTIPMPELYSTLFDKGFRCTIPMPNTQHPLPS